MNLAICLGVYVHLFLKTFENLITKTESDYLYTNMFVNKTGQVSSFVK